MSEQMHSDFAELNRQMEQLDDPRQCYALVQERIRRYRSEGSSVPEQLSRLEKALIVECLAESQGR